MKKIFRYLGAALALTAALITSVIPTSAASFSDAKNSVVYIESEFSNGSYIFWNSNINDYSSYSYARFRGSGFAIGEVGQPVSYIVTNAHLVLDETADAIHSEILGNLNATSQRATEVKVYFSYGANDFMRAQIYMVDEAKDICVLKLPEATTKREPLVICRSTDIDMDDDFAALGFPGASDIGMDETSLSYGTDDITVTKGAISRKSTDRNGVQVYLIDIDISGGNSGGPLVNSKGEVVGINTYGVGDSRYAIVIDELLGLVNRDVVPYTLSSEVSAPAADETQEDVSSETTSSNTRRSGGIVVTAAFIIGAAVIVAVVILKKKPAAKASAPVQSAQPIQPAPAQAYAARTVTILGVSGAMAGKSFILNGSIIIGRNPEKCNVSLPVTTQGVSGVHCEIRRNGSGCEIIDLGSSCGTFLGNGQKLTPNVPVNLPSGMYFYLGSSEQLFQINY